MGTLTEAYNAGLICAVCHKVCERTWSMDDGVSRRCDEHALIQAHDRLTKIYESIRKQCLTMPIVRLRRINGVPIIPRGDGVWAQQ